MRQIYLKRSTEYLYCKMWDKYRTFPQNICTVHYNTNMQPVHRISILYTVRQIHGRSTEYIYIYIVRCKKNTERSAEYPYCAVLERQIRGRSLKGSDRKIRPTHRISVMYSERQIWDRSAEYPTLFLRSVNYGRLGTTASKMKAENIWSYEMKFKSLVRITSRWASLYWSYL